MIPDYYKILDVPENASPEIIKKAYRTKALKCHPDRGGSHEQMLAINEAYEVLTNPSLRQQYDYARAHRSDRSAQDHAAAASSQARERAADYPREWAAFEAWINRITADFKNAEYSQTKGGGPLSSPPLPTAGSSITGWLFIIGGGTAGFIFWSTVILSLGIWAYLKIFLMMGCVSGGAWLGRFLHEGIAGSIRKPNSASPSGSTVPVLGIIHCPQCSQKLRLPSITQSIRVTCPSCKHVFPHNVKS